jgi:hypothetical protein
MIKFVGTNAVPKLDHGRAWLLRPDGAGKTLTIKLGPDLYLQEYQAFGEGDDYLDDVDDA